MSKRGKRPSSRRAIVISIGAAVAALVAVSVILTGGRLGANAGGVTPTATIQATATTKPTMAPTASPTVAPTATANAQAKLNAQAAAAFRSVTVATFSDAGCAAANARSHFSASQPVYINLCVAGSQPPGPVTVVARQGGAVVRTLVYNQYLTAGSSYAQGHTLPPGSYDMLVTVRINGSSATAKDIPFTVS